MQAAQKALLATLAGTAIFYPFLVFLGAPLTTYVPSLHRPNVPSKLPLPDPP